MAEQLLLEGWEILARNWRGGGGELDLVVVRDGCLRLVEVKARSPQDPVGIEAIDAGKRRRLVGAARAFMSQHEDLVEEVCFLVAQVDLDAGGPRAVTWIDDAFDARLS